MDPGKKGQEMTGRGRGGWKVSLERVGSLGKAKRKRWGKKGVGVEVRLGK